MWRWALLLIVTLLAVGCASRPVPDVDRALKDYARAAAHGDAVALHAMLRKEDRNEISLAELKEIVALERAELKERAGVAETAPASVKAQAEVRFEDGESVGLILEDHAFRVAAGGTLPGGAATPEGALGDLRRALMRKQFGGILRVLAPATRRTMETDLKSLASGLEHPESLPLQVKDDHAEVKVSGGHVVRLKRAGGGIWYVDYFD